MNEFSRSTRLFLHDPSNQDAAKSTALRDHIIYYMTACCRRSSSTPAATVHPISSRWEEAGCTWQQIDGRPCKLSAHGKLVVTLELDGGDDGNGDGGGDDDDGDEV